MTVEPSKKAGIQQPSLALSDEELRALGIVMVNWARSEIYLQGALISILNEQDEKKTYKIYQSEFSNVKKRLLRLLATNNIKERARRYLSAIDAFSEKVKPYRNMFAHGLPAHGPKGRVILSRGDIVDLDHGLIGRMVEHSKYMSFIAFHFQQICFSNEAWEPPWPDEPPV